MDSMGVMMTAGYLRRSSREKLKAMSAKAYAYKMIDAFENEIEVNPTSRWQTILRKGYKVKALLETSSGKKVPGHIHKHLTLLAVVKDMKRRIAEQEKAKEPKLPTDLVNFGQVDEDEADS